MTNITHLRITLAVLIAVVLGAASVIIVNNGPGASAAAPAGCGH